VRIISSRSAKRNRNNFPGIVSGLEGLFRLSNVRFLRCCALPDEVGKPRHVGSARNSKSVPQVVPEWQAKLLAGFLPSGIGIARPARPRFGSRTRSCAGRHFPGCRFQPRLWGAASPDGRARATAGPCSPSTVRASGRGWHNRYACRRSGRTVSPQGCAKVTFFKFFVPKLKFSLATQHLI